MKILLNSYRRAGQFSEAPPVYPCEQAESSQDLGEINERRFISKQPGLAGRHGISETLWRVGNKPSAAQANALVDAAQKPGKPRIQARSVAGLHGALAAYG